MDVRRSGFFAYLSLNGKPLTLQGNQGSIMSLIAESLKTLSNERSRLTPDGELEVLIRIRNQPMDTSKEGILLLGRTEEVEALVDAPADQPRVNESYEQFYERLLSMEYPQASAEYMAAQWFNREVNPETTLWLNDPKAIRFRVLNSRDEAFENALPQEYESLKNYVLTTYPNFVEHLVFRTA